jgi:prolyl oligopeptidase
MSSTFKYPAVCRDEEVKEDYHGTIVADPYRWLENPDSEETKKFIDEQNDVTMPFIQSCCAREDIKARLTKLWDFPKFGCPLKAGSRYFYFSNTGLQNQSVLYVQDSLTSEPRVFLDPNTLSADGTVAISTYKFSEDGETFAYALSSSGSDWIKIHLKNVATGKDYPEVLEKAKFTGITWSHDNRGIFYGRYPDQDGTTDGSETTSNENQKVFYHQVGTSQSEDVLMVEFPENPKWRIGTDVSDCGDYLVVSVQMEGRDNLIYYANLVEPLKKGLKTKLDVIPIVDKFEADYEYIANNGTQFYFRTSKDAPNYRIIAIDFKSFRSRMENSIR